MRLLQICANVKSGAVRQNQGKGEREGREVPHNLRIFIVLRGYVFLIFQQVKPGAPIVLRERLQFPQRFPQRLGSGT
jgi:hypothetical protein